MLKKCKEDLFFTIQYCNRGGSNWREEPHFDFQYYRLRLLLVKVFLEKTCVDQADIFLCSRLLNH